MNLLKRCEFIRKGLIAFLWVAVFSASLERAVAIPLDTANLLKAEILSEASEKDFRRVLNEIKDGGLRHNLLDFYLAQLEHKEHRIALIWLLLTSKNNFHGSFKNLSDVYFATPPLPKRDILLKKIKEFTLNYNGGKDIEDIVWFYMVTENENLISYLTTNAMSVESLIEIIKQRNEFAIFQKIIFNKTNEISELLWSGSVKKAIPLIMEMPNGETKQMFLARVYFQTRDKKYKIYAQSFIEKGELNEEGLVYDYIKYLKKTEHYKAALGLLSSSKINYSNPKIAKIWIILEELFRHYLDSKEYEKAYRVVSETRFNPEDNPQIYVRAKFLSGFVAMKFLKNYDLALKAFKKIYEVKNGSVYTRSTGAYFLARTYLALGKKDLYRKWLLIAARYVNTFYGIMAIETLNNVEPVTLLGLELFTKNRINEALKRRNEIHKFYFDDLVGRYYVKDIYFKESVALKLKQNINFRIGFLMLKLGRIEDANGFFGLSVADMSEKEIKLGFDFLNNYLKANNILNANLIINTFAVKAANYGVLIADAYPIIEFILNKPELAENALIHAIIKQESNFMIRAISGPGAIGLMQIMPSTGKLASRSAGLGFNIQKLKGDYQYNIKVGSFYLDTLLKNFNYVYPFALIGYNAGPNRVSIWKKRYFEPQNREEMIDFIELIPFKETRNYVFRVIENEVFYNYLLNNHLDQSLITIQTKDKFFQSLTRKKAGP